MGELIQKLRKEADAIDNELEEVMKIINGTDVARRKNEAAYSKKDSLRRKYYKLIEKIEHLDRYSANKKLRKIVKKIIDSAEEDCNNFKFFENAEAKFQNFGEHGRQLHVNIECSQVCDHDIKEVLNNAEKVTSRKIVDWFISASIGYNPKEDARAWLTYHLTFKGEDTESQTTG